MEKTRDQVIDDLCKRGFLNYLFDDKKFSTSDLADSLSGLLIWYFFILELDDLIITSVSLLFLSEDIIESKEGVSLTNILPI